MPHLPRRTGLHITHCLVRCVGFHTTSFTPCRYPLFLCRTFTLCHLCRCILVPTGLFDFLLRLPYTRSRLFCHLSICRPTPSTASPACYPLPDFPDSRWLSWTLLLRYRYVCVYSRRTHHTLHNNLPLPAYTYLHTFLPHLHTCLPHHVVGLPPCYTIHLRDGYTLHVPLTRTTYLHTTWTVATFAGYYATTRTYHAARLDFRVPHVCVHFVLPFAFVRYTFRCSCSRDLRLRYTFRVASLDFAVDSRSLPVGLFARCSVALRFILPVSSRSTDFSPRCVATHTYIYTTTHHTHTPLCSGSFARLTHV